MAVVTTKSTAITNQDADPRVANDAGKGAGYREVSIDSNVAVVNGDSIGSKYIAVRVPSHAIVKSVHLKCQALGAGALTDVGVYYASNSKDNGQGQTAGAVIDADFFGSAIDVSAAISTGAEITHESGVCTLADLMIPLWEAVGLSSDPRGKLDIVATLTAAAAASGNLYLRVTYVE